MMMMMMIVITTFDFIIYQIKNVLVFRLFFYFHWIKYSIHERSEQQIFLSICVYVCVCV